MRRRSPGRAPRPTCSGSPSPRPPPVARDGEVVIAADTTVSIDGHIIGKPADRAGALDTLRVLSGRTHTVYTGLAVLSLAVAAATVPPT